MANSLASATHSLFAACYPLLTIRYSLFSSPSPYFLRQLDDHAQLRPFLLLGENVALLGGGEAALRGQAELLERREFGGFLNAAFDIVLLLQRSALGGDEAKHHNLVALRKKAQRLEAAGPLGVVFEEIA